MLDIAKKASLAAGKKILEIYNSNDFAIQLKGDCSPLTKADQAAHDIIMSFLEPLGIPVLSEEGRFIPYSERSKWDYFWITDPLDGTKEFIKRNGEFTVNIALVNQGKPTLGVVYAPVLDKLYSGAKGLGVTLNITGKVKNLLKRRQADMSKAGIKVVTSRSHLNKATQLFIDHLDSPEVICMGSSLKFMLIAEGKAHIYPRFALTMEWDTAAAHAILLELGSDVVDPLGNSLEYNKENLLNPYFKAV